MQSGLGLAAVLAVSLGSLLSPFWETSSREASRGMEAYENQEWSVAAEHFRRAQLEEPDPVTSFNLGAAAYKEENWAEAQSSFEAASGSDAVSKGAAAYNLGNVHYQNQDLGGALAAYRTALREDPTDEDARFNYELTLRQLESQSEQQQDQDQDQEQEQEPEDGDEGESGKQNTPPGGEDQPDENQDTESASAGDDQEPPPDEEQQGQPPEPSSGDEEKQLLTPEQAVQLLNAITQEERELIQARLKAARKTKVEKDW